MKIVAKFVAAAAVLATLTAAPASAQSVSSQVFYVMDMMRADIARRESGAPPNEGYLYFNGTVSSLYDDENQFNHIVQDWGGGIITIAGFCSTNCNDLDLYVLDQNDNVVAQDVASDPRPVVTFRPAQTGAYTLRVAMFDCVGKCYYATAVYFRED
ncbi:MAG: PPC domain-containing protein [Hyphomonadaceae bacterium]|nr:PPC domain-containing protein [Hyphomonadaceae bacterium]